MVEGPPAEIIITIPEPHVPQRIERPAELAEPPEPSAWVRAAVEYIVALEALTDEAIGEPEALEAARAGLDGSSPEPDG